jgi:hypothetical protein
MDLNHSSQLKDARRFLDLCLDKVGETTLVLPPTATPAQWRIALELVRYAAWRARVSSLHEVAVRRFWSSDHGLAAHVCITSTPASFPDVMPDLP